MNLETRSFIVLLVLVTLLFGALLLDFFQPIFWAATLGVIFHPLHVRLLPRVRQRQSIAALLTLVIICLTVILPLWFVFGAVVNETALLYQKIQAGDLGVDKVFNWVRMNFPLVPELLDSVGITLDDIRSAASTAAIATSQFIGTMAVTAGQGAARLALMFVLMLYVLFFFLRDGDMLTEQLVYALPLGDARERALMAKFAEVSRATVKGTLLIGVLQGFLGGVIFALLGVQAAVFWGTVMVVLSVIPLVGASLIWIPAAIGMVVNGAYVDAMILVFFGAVIIGLLDNVLRPILVGRDTKMPDYLILLSTLGGLSMFGASGFVIGPVIASLFLTVWLMFAREFNDTTGAELYDADDTNSE